MSKQTVGYARANNPNDLPSYVAELTEAGCSAVFTDCIGGDTINRPGLSQAYATLKSGDTLVVPSMDRIARSLEVLTAIRAELQRRGVELVLLAKGDEAEESSADVRKLLETVLNRHKPQ